MTTPGATEAVTPDPSSEDDLLKCARALEQLLWYAPVPQPVGGATDTQWFYNGAYKGAEVILADIKFRHPGIREALRTPATKACQS